jgi:hypothetical protein
MIASNGTEEFHCAWSQLAGGAAPVFDRLVQDSVKLLLSYSQPLAGLSRTFTDRDWCKKLLNQDEGADIVMFSQWFELLSVCEQADRPDRLFAVLTCSPLLSP